MKFIAVTLLAYSIFSQPNMPDVYIKKVHEPFQLFFFAICRKVICLEVVYQHFSFGICFLAYSFVQAYVIYNFVLVYKKGMLETNFNICKNCSEV